MYVIYTLKYWLGNKATIVVRTREIILNIFSSLFFEMWCIRYGNFKIFHSFPR